jgi:hypothetical protein
MTMPEQSQMRDIQDRAEKLAALTNELLAVMHKHADVVGPQDAGLGLMTFLARYVSGFSNPCQLVEDVMNGAHEAMHRLGLVVDEESLESIPERDFYHA